MSADADAVFYAICRAETPDEELKKICEAKGKADPAMMPYFALQHDDYVTLKERATAHILSGAPGAPEGMATIDIALDALKVLATPCRAVSRSYIVPCSSIGTTDFLDGRS